MGPNLMCRRAGLTVCEDVAACFLLLLRQGLSQVECAQAPAPCLTPELCTLLFVTLFGSNCDTISK